MIRVKYLILAMVLAAGLAVPALAQQGDHQATTPPLVQLLQSKGILTAAEAAQISQAATAEDANARLAQLLLAKGLISESDFNTTVGPLVNTAGNANANAGTGHFMNALIHVPAGDGYAPDGSSGAAEEPASIHFKGITLTPGGFLAGTTTWRQRAISAGSSTPFNSIPFSTQNNGNIGEFNTEARQSLFSLLAEGHVGSTRLRGYLEGDFNSAGTTSNNNSTDSYTLRMRQAWAQAALDNGWTFTGGQMWSLVTASRSGVNPLTEIIPMTIDSGYTVGFNYARQEGFRVTKALMDNKLFLALSVENPELNSVGGTSCSAGACIYGQPGNATGLFNVITTPGLPATYAAQIYSYNGTPDFIFKVAVEPGFGHYEFFGLIDTFRQRFFPCFDATVAAPCVVNTAITAASSFGANDRTTTGGGVGVNAYGSMFDHHLDANFTFMGGNGIGRYGGTTGFSDVVVNANQELVALRNYRSYAGLILHPTPKLDIYAYVGGDYLQRAHGYGQTPEGVPLALSAGCFTEPLPASATTLADSPCNAVTRDIIEGTLGFWYRFFKGPMGTLQFGMQYSYIDRNTWAGTEVIVVPDSVRIAQGGPTTGTIPAAPHATENMVFTSFRYYLP